MLFALAASSRNLFCRLSSNSLQEAHKNSYKDTSLHKTEADQHAPVSLSGGPHRIRLGIGIERRVGSAIHGHIRSAQVDRSGRSVGGGRIIVCVRAGLRLTALHLLVLVRVQHHRVARGGQGAGQVQVVLRDVALPRAVVHVAGNAQTL